jgi:hypothetical protein
MPCDYSRYPANWFTEIRPRILARAGDQCERCGVPNHENIAVHDARQHATSRREDREKLD